MLPALELEARIRLAQLLLKHTEHAALAKLRLDPASLLLPSLAPHQVGLKAQLYKVLGEVYRLLPGYTRQRKATLRKGLELTEQGKSENWVDAAGWEVYFQGQVAEMFMYEGDTAAAQNALLLAQHSAGSLPIAQQVAVALGQFQVMLSANPYNAGLMHLAAENAETFVTQLPADVSGSSLRVQHLLLKSWKLLREGATSEASHFTTVVRPQLEQEFAALAQSDFAPSPYTSWLSPPVIAGLVHLTLGVSHRPAGKFAQSNAHFNKGLEIVDAELARLKLLNLPAGVVEAHLSLAALNDAHHLLLLKYVVLENMAQISLTQTQTTRAQEQIAAAAELCRKFPGLLRTCCSGLHVLVGMYAHSLSLWPQAIRHLKHARQIASNHQQRTLAEVNLALAQLADGTPASHSAAQDILVPLFRNLEETLGAQEQALVSVSSGLALAAQGEVAEARVRVTKALRLSHGTLGNHQLVTHTLTLLGGLNLTTNDHQQATDMLKNARILAKNIHDLPAHVLVLKQPIPDGNELAPSFRSELPEKYAELQQMVQMATSAKLHNHILQFFVEPDQVAAA